MTFKAVEKRVEDNKQFFKSDALQSHFVVKHMGHELEALRLSGSPLACEELPIVHRAISLLKRFLMGTYHGVSSRYLQRYLNEFCFRWNRRNAEQHNLEQSHESRLLRASHDYAELTL